MGEGEGAKRKIGYRDIKVGYLAAVRSFYSWAVKKKRAPSNPAADIEFEVEKQPRLRQPYFTEDERKLILSESLRQPSGRESAEFAAAKRWIPWICAYTGARVNEITQLRGKDVKEHRLGDEVVGTTNIPPEAGRQKTGEAREAPLHPHLVDQGFLAFAKG